MFKHVFVLVTFTVLLVTEHEEPKRHISHGKSRDYILINSVTLK